MYLGVTGRSTLGRLSAGRHSSKLSMAFSSAKTSNFFTVGITGSSGLLGSSLIDELSKTDTTVYGKSVRIVRLIRANELGTDTLSAEPVTSLPWNPSSTTPENVINPEALDQMDAIVHLAGENIGTGQGPLGFLGIRPWTDKKKDEIMNSRVGPTEALAKAIAASKTPTSFLSASGVGVYGNKFFAGNQLPAADETMDVSAVGGFLAEVSRRWEAASEIAGENARIVNCRMGVVLSKKGGALQKLFPVFFLGGGGDVGSGKQYFTFISARDAARALVHTLSTPSLEGPVNFCAPEPCTNSEFTKALGKVLSRPTIIPLPSFAVSLLFGEMGEETLLGGVRAIPGKLAKSGFEFQHPNIESACQSAVDERI